MSISKINSVINAARTKRTVKMKAFATKQSRVGTRSTGASVSARSSAVSKSGTSSALMQILYGMTGNTSTTGEKLVQNQAQRYEYETMQLAAERVGKHLDALVDDGENSLFAQGEEKREAVEKEISGLVSDYNIMIRKLNASGDEADAELAKKLTEEITTRATTLKQLGITQDSKGVLSLNLKTLQQADYEDLKKVFGSSVGLPKKLQTLAGSVQKTAKEQISRLEKEMYTLSTTYSRYGTSDNSYGWTGSRYSTKG